MDKQKMLEEKQMTVIDSEGNEHLFQILFTFDNEERKCSYVFFYENENDEDIMVMRFYEDGHLEELDSEEEYQEAEEVLLAFDEDPAIEELKKA